MPRAAIAGIGSYLPEDRLTNADLERMVDTSDEWILTRTGIAERRVVAAGEATSDLAVRAARAALADAGIDGAGIDLLIVATSTPDTLIPATACRVQAELGLTCPAFDVNAACSGFVYALQVGVTVIESGRARTVLVVGADAMTRFIDFTDRGTCILFGDGAGAVVLRASEEAGVLGIALGADGTGAEMLKVPAGGSALPLAQQVLDARQQYLTMSGNEVFKFAVRVIPKAAREALKASGATAADLTWLVPHQANQRIIDTVADRLHMPHERVFSNVAATGNTSAASIPVALDDLYTSGRLSAGDLVAVVGFGAGVTWGAAVVRWTKSRSSEET
ncbi:MAG: 3-oxoacyl-ACP synthase [Coriobacteriaceae bacterium]|nr:3-oxoacyl-ACP synthase [Coriobacteriaceae bacterium]